MEVIYLVSFAIFCIGVYRFCKWWTRSCHCCGSRRVRRFPRNVVRNPAYPRDVISEMVKVCDNPFCRVHNREVIEKSYHRVYTPLELWWRKDIWHEQFI